MKALKDLLYGVALEQVVGSTAQLIEEIQFDSRKIERNDLYLAQKGTQVDGHQFIDQAIAAGANTIVCETLPERVNENIVYIKVADSAEALGVMAANFYDQPSKKITLIGVTGTNGKTTTVTLLYELFRKLGKSVGLISTVVNKINEKEIKSTHTTPDAIQLNQLLARMKASEVEYCFMEVSSHAVAQKRVYGVDFAGGVFTNISRDHLDFHKTFKDYITAKQAFFTSLSKDAFALSNLDDKNGEVMLQNSKATKNYYALKSVADFNAKVIESNFQGLNLQIDGQDFWSPLIGAFNAYNLTAVYATALLLQQDKLEVLTALSELNTVAGRFQYFLLNNIHGIVDYAHTPDALENVLKTIKLIRTRNERVITVVGCGGDRDIGKRPKMAAIAVKFSDQVILTSDNPRTENPQEIINDMKAGVDAASGRKVLAIENRKEAIRTAVSLAVEEDILLIAGKGHETYQEINGVRNHFDDREELKNAINELKN